MRACDIAREKSWSEEGVTVITKEGLAIEGLGGLRETLLGADWNLFE